MSTVGKKYVSLALAAPEFGPCKLYTNLGRAAGEDNDGLLAYSHCITRPEGQS
jgi:uncharacterized protein (DUF736 family)